MALKSTCDMKPIDMGTNTSDMTGDISQIRHATLDDFKTDRKSSKIATGDIAFS